MPDSMEGDTAAHDDCHVPALAVEIAPQLNSRHERLSCQSADDAGCLDSPQHSQAAADQDSALVLPPVLYSVSFILIARVYHGTHSMVRKLVFPHGNIPSHRPMLATHNFSCYADDVAVLRANRAFRSLHLASPPHELFHVESDVVTTSAQREDLIDSVVVQCFNACNPHVDAIIQGFAHENAKIAEDVQHHPVRPIEIKSRLQELRARKDALPSPRFRSRLCCGMLASMAILLTNGGLPPKARCKLCCSLVSHVASRLLARTGEGFHHAGLRFRAACENGNAARCFARAVSLKHGPSHAELSYMYIGNCSLPKDLHMAMHLAAEGAKLNCNDSKAALASCLRFCLLDEDRAVQLAQESAAAGNSWGCSELGLMLQHGIGVERDLERAAAYTSKAAHLGNAWARHNIGLMYATGCGVEQNFCQAEQCEPLWPCHAPADTTPACSFFRLAAEQGLSSAQNRLGLLYSKGLCVPKDAERAKFWWSRSAAQGDETAVRLLGEGDVSSDEDAD